MLLIGLSMPLVTIMFMPKMFTVNNPMRLLSACLQWHHEPAPHAMFVVSAMRQFYHL